MQNDQLDCITAARLEAGGFARDPEFELTAHAARGFGIFLASVEYGAVIWHVTPAATRKFPRHPT